MMSLRRASTITLLLGFLGSSAQADTTFKAGSLIIPTTATYQHDCGATAVYGLVYDVMRANAWLATQGYPKIKIYYSYKDTKASPNRCTPTNLHVGPSYTGSGVVLHDHPKWNDGCDFSVQDPNNTPVKQIDNNAGDLLASDIDIVTVDTSSKSTVFPRWPSKTITHTTSPATNVHTVRYYGGPFIIADKDAITFAKLLRGTLVAKDSSGNNIDFSPFRQAIGTCTFGTTVGGYVRIHRAKVSFTAPTPRIFQSAPPRLALLADNTAAMTKTVSKGILEQYLQNAGLSFTGAFGCAPGGVNVANATLCPIGDNRGQVFDFFDFADIKNGKLAATDVSGKPVYKMIWAPHWQTYGTTSSDPTANEKTAIENIATFINGQAGLMGECHSIEALEGAYDNGSADERGNLPNNAGTGIGGQFQTCLKSGAVCAASQTLKYGVNKNPSQQLTSMRQNCTDPTLNNNAECMYYSYPGDGFAQSGDYLWDPKLGTVRSFLPNTAQNAIYRPGVLPLISGVKSLNKSLLTNNGTARAMVVTDYSTRSNKDNDPNKGNVLYVAGHDLTGVVSGTKLILQTLLLLGEAPIVYQSFEVSRSNPIVAPINGEQVIVQGTVENVVPDPPTPVMTNSIDATNFTFPSTIGHMRAFRLTGTGAINTSAQNFSTAAALFDTNALIPTASYAGCGTYYNSTCRSVFTNTAAGFNPARVELKSANLATLGPIMAPGLTATEHAILVQRVLAGIEDDSNPGTFLSKLGGVDRSTVAIVPQSILAGTTRPTMIYFGASDGMIHAVCGSVLSGVCDVLGRELWAYIPRTQLPKLRLNAGRIDSSPRVYEMFGDFFNTGTRSFHTILLFHTSTPDDSTLVNDQPGVYALDITDPRDPKIIWEYTTPASPTALELGQGLVVAAGKVNISGNNKLVAFAQTNNGGTGGSGMVVTAINIETGAQIWSSGYTHPAPRNVANPTVPATGIPGGAIALDRLGNGFVNDIVFGTLYGDIFDLDAATGTNKYGSTPLFRMSADMKPFGASLALYSLGGQPFAVGVTGGYVDQTAATQWSSGTQSAVAVSLTTPTSPAPPATLPLTENSGAPYVPVKIDFAAGEKAFAQAQVVGDQIFFTTDTADVNSDTYGTNNTNTGKVYQAAVGSSTVITTTTTRGGASYVGVSGNNVYTSGSDKTAQLGVSSSGNAGEVINTPAPQVSRRLWLRTL
jgi:hypothetical protein